MLRRTLGALLTSAAVLLGLLALPAGPASAAVGPADLSISLRGITTSGNDLIFQYTVRNLGPGDVPANPSQTDGRAYTLIIEVPSGVLCNGQRFQCTGPGAHASRVKVGTGWIHTFRLSGSATPGARMHLFVQPHPSMTDPDMGNNSTSFDVSEL